MTLELNIYFSLDRKLIYRDIVSRGELLASIYSPDGMTPLRIKLWDEGKASGFSETLTGG